MSTFKIQLLQTKITNTNSYITIHYNYMKKLLNAHRFCHLVFARMKITN